MLIFFTPGISCRECYRETAEFAALGRRLCYDERTELFVRHRQYRPQ